MGIDHVERFQIGAAGSMNNTSKFRRIDAFGQWCLQWGRSEELRLTGFQFSIMSCTAWAAQRESEQSQNGGDVRVLLKLFPTFFTGHPCVLLQFKTLQVEGITVVSERHPCPPSQKVGALARVGPLVQHRLIWQGGNIIKTFNLQSINAD